MDSFAITANILKHSIPLTCGGFIGSLLTIVLPGDFAGNRQTPRRTEVYDRRSYVEPQMPQLACTEICCLAGLSDESRWKAICGPGRSHSEGYIRMKRISSPSRCPIVSESSPPSTSTTGILFSRLLAVACQRNPRQSHSPGHVTLDSSETLTFGYALAHVVFTKSNYYGRYVAAAEYGSEVNAMKKYIKAADEDPTSTNMDIGAN